MKNFLSQFVILSLLFWLTPEFSFTHDELSEQVQLVSEKIKTNPRDASLYFERAELYRGDQHWSLAEKDYFQARKLSPELAAVQLGLGMLYYNTKRYEDSIQALDRFLLKHPDHSEGLITRGRDQKMLGNFSAAIDDYSSALQLRPDPAIYIERSRLLVSDRKSVV